MSESKYAPFFLHKSKINHMHKYSKAFDARSRQHSFFFVSLTGPCFEVYLDCSLSLTFASSARNLHSTMIALFGHIMLHRFDPVFFFFKFALVIFFFFWISSLDIFLRCDGNGVMALFSCVFKIRSTLFFVSSD